MIIFILVVAWLSAVLDPTPVPTSDKGFSSSAYCWSCWSSSSIEICGQSKKTLERSDPCGFDLDEIWDREWRDNLLRAALDRVKPRGAWDGQCKRPPEQMGLLRAGM
jgi:hypothetical protein